MHGRWGVAAPQTLSVSTPYKLPALDCTVYSKVTRAASAEFLPVAKFDCSQWSFDRSTAPLNNVRNGARISVCACGPSSAFRVSARWIGAEEWYGPVTRSVGKAGSGGPGRGKREVITKWLGTN